MNTLANVSLSMALKPVSYTHLDVYKRQAIIGLDAQDNKDLETPMYYDRAVRELKELKIERIDELRMLI